MKTKIRKIACKIYHIIGLSLRDKAFGVAVAVSLFLWVLYTLSGTFTTMITVPVTISGAVVNGVADSDSDDDNKVKLDCRVTGQGFSILKHIIFSGLTIDMMDVSVVKQANGTYSVTPESLDKAVRAKLQGLNLLNIYDARLELISLTKVSKQVPVELDVEVQSDGEFMMVGEPVIEPKQVEVIGLPEELEKIRSVKTRYVNIRDKSSHVSGSVALVEEDNVYLPTKEVYYSISFDRYAEMRVSKKVMLRKTGKNNYTTIPATVDVIFNVAEDIYSDFNHDNFPLYVDLRQSEASSSYLGGNRYVLDYKNLPKGVTVRMISPRYVTVVKTNTEAVVENGEQDRNLKVGEMLNLMNNL